MLARDIPSEDTTSSSTPTSPDPPFLALKGHSPGPFRCLPQLLTDIQQLGTQSPGPRSLTPHFSCRGQSSGLTPQDLHSSHTFQSRGLTAGTLLWTTFSLSAGRATRLWPACGWTTRRTTSTRGELGWLGARGRAKTCSSPPVGCSLLVRAAYFPIQCDED